jgi:hypothetical protein
MPDTPTIDFAAIQSKAACVFAPRARIESAPAFSGTEAYAAGAAAFGSVRDFAARADADELDGLLIELVDPIHGDSPTTLATTLRSVLTSLVSADGGSPEAALQEANSDHWWLTLCGTRWFVLVFAPCYPSDSPRHTFGSSSTYVLLQPVSSFDRRATPRGTTITQEIRERIRDAYAARGCPYDGELAQQDVESLKFVWPLQLGDQPVRWWSSSAEHRQGSR